jgi:hypothetical protein
VPDGWAGKKHDPEETESSRDNPPPEGYLKQVWADSKLDPSVVMTPEEVTARPTFVVNEIRGDWGSNLPHRIIQQTIHGHSYDQLHDGNRDPTLVETHQEFEESSKDTYYRPLMTQIWHKDGPPRYQDNKKNWDGDSFRQRWGIDQSKGVDTEWSKRQSSTNSPRNQFPWGNGRGVLMSSHSRSDIRKDRGDPSLTEFQNNSNIWPKVRDYKKFYLSMEKEERNDDEATIAQEVTGEKATSAHSRSSPTDVQLQSNRPRVQNKGKHKCDQNKNPSISRTDSAHDASKQTSVTKSEIGINYSVFGNHRH